MTSHADIPKSIVICQNPHGDGLWFESGRERCPEPGCDCSPARYVLADPTDEMVERVAVSMVGNGDPDYWRCLSEPQKEWHRGRARRALDAAFRICAMRGDEPPRTEATDRQAPRRPEPLDAEAHAMTDDASRERAS